MLLCALQRISTARVMVSRSVHSLRLQNVNLPGWCGPCVEKLYLFLVDTMCFTIEGYDKAVQCNIKSRLSKCDN